MSGELVFLEGYLLWWSIYLFFFFFCFFALPLLSLFSFDLFRCCWKFWAGLTFTCLHVRGTFCVAATDITDSKQQQQQREREKRGKKTTKIKLPFAP